MELLCSAPLHQSLFKRSEGRDIAACIPRLSEFAGTRGIASGNKDLRAATAWWARGEIRHKTGAEEKDAGGGALYDVSCAVNTSRYLLGRKPLCAVALIDALFRSGEHAGWESIQRGNHCNSNCNSYGSMRRQPDCDDSAVIDRSTPPRESRAQRCRNPHAARQKKPALRSRPELT